MATQSNHIVEIYKSRKNLLDCLYEQQGYNIDKYANFNIHEVNSMFQAKQLDMLVENEKTGKKAYVKYHLGKALRPNNIYEVVEDLFNSIEMGKTMIESLGYEKYENFPKMERWMLFS